jgi:predicted XRE-type DNA-binding protein
MNDDSSETVGGSGNVFRDFGYPDADVRQAKALLGTQIMRILDEEGLSTREAEARSGVSHSEFSRIRRANFSRFTIDRLMAILGRLGQEVELSVSVHPRVGQGASSHEVHPTP